MLKDLLTRNAVLKTMAIAIALILWIIARYWLLK